MMTALNKREPIILLIGDLLTLVLSLWITLFIRYAKLPDSDTLSNHLAPFSILFVVSILIFFIAGLYDKQTLLLKSRQPGKIWGAQVANAFVAIIFFYFIPYFGITPKVSLFIYLVISLVLISLWRFIIHSKFITPRKVKAVIVGAGKEIEQLKSELNNNIHSGLNVILAIDLDHLDRESVSINGKFVCAEKLHKMVLNKEFSVLVLDLAHENADSVVPSLHEVLFAGIECIDTRDLYEDIFDKEPISLINDVWFLEHISLSPSPTYDFLKRVLDILVAIPLGLISLIFYPIAWAAIKSDDKGPLFIFQERIGRSGKVIQIVKFRTMSAPKGDSGKWVTKNDARITRAGKWLRKSRIDELPQLWNVLKGDLSLIGPRPELPRLVDLYNKEIPHYNIRHLITPGLSGWAQIHHDVPPHSVEETKEKLSYDLYYIKHRSFILDIVIALKTINTLLSRTGI